MAKSKTTYILDTNVLISSPYAINAFDEHDVVVTDVTLEELDKYKSAFGEKGANAREVVRILKNLRQIGNLHEGVPLILGGGTFKTVMGEKYPADILPASWDASSPDNRILAVCKELIDSKKNIILVSNDINMLNKADMLQIKAEEYRTEQMQQIDKQYTGRREILVNAGMVDKFYENSENGIQIDGLAYEDKDADFTLNEFVILKDIADFNKTALGRFDGNKVVPLVFSKDKPYGAYPRNSGQHFAQEALMTNVKDAPLVILKGPAGTSKTFYSLAVGLNKVLETKQFGKILVVRPNVKFDDDIGYLKGDEDEKIAPLIRPIMDNLSVLTKFTEHTGKSEEQNYIQYLFDKKYIEAQAMAYMRGRSIPDTWVIIDEAQNMSPTQAFGIISRAGNNCKIILAGDSQQIDNPRLDSRTNGLTYASERMKGSPLCWQVTFLENECVRSRLALEAINRMSLKGM